VGSSHVEGDWKGQKAFLRNDAFTSKTLISHTPVQLVQKTSLQTFHAITLATINHGIVGGRSIAQVVDKWGELRLIVFAD
jgi:hypothetical protein